jgi:enoyl-CoA hydratase
MAELSDVRYRQLRVERLDRGVVLATLDNPDRRNSMSGEMTRSWAELMTTVSNDASVRCLVVTGAGSAFCSGGDMDWLAATPNASVDDLRERMLPFYRTWLAIRDLPVPSIAAVNGPAVGAGLCLALACDLRYASADASLSAPFTALGLHAGMAATWLLPQFGGLGLARELLLTGRVLTGTDAAAAGLVNRSFPAESLLTEALGIAGSVAAKAPIATRLTKAALAEGAPVSIEAALQWEALAQPVTMATADLREGLAAQRERRKPEFTGR